MAINCLAPGFLRLHYTSNGHAHTMTLPVDPVGSGSGILFNKKGGGTISPSSAVSALAAVLVPFFATADSLDAYEVFTQADCASAPVFETSGTLTGVDGTAGSADVPWSQLLLTFRSAGGGRGKFQIMESTVGDDVRDSLPGLSSGVLYDLYQYLIGANSWILARDNTFLAAGIFATSKENDTLRKKYLL